MALHVSPEILEQYHGFYSLALDGTTDDGVTDDGTTEDGVSNDTQGGVMPIARDAEDAPAEE